MDAIYSRMNELVAVSPPFPQAGNRRPPDRAPPPFVFGWANIGPEEGINGMWLGSVASCCY